MSIGVKTGPSQWSNVVQPSYKLAGAWVPLKRVLTKVNGEWKEVWLQTRTIVNDSLLYAVNIADAFGNPSDAAHFVYINNGSIGGALTAAALTSGILPAGSSLTIINNGRIEGIGGKGGWYNGDGSNTLPTAGGDALLLQFPTVLDNTNGMIYGGGGGGGGSAEWGGDNDNNAPGGGGAGIPAGDHGDVTWIPSGNYGSFTLATADTGGWNYHNGATIGIGGNPGQPGGPGAPVGKSTNRYQGGGAAGRAIIGSSFILSLADPNSRILGAVV